MQYSIFDDLSFFFRTVQSKIAAKLFDYVIKRTWNKTCKNCFTKKSKTKYNKKLV